MSNNSVVNWLRKYVTYCVAAFLAFAIGLTVVFTTTGSAEQDLNISSAENPVVSVGTQPEKVLSFVLPMENAAVLKNFSSEDLYYNTTLERYEFHDGIDLTSNNLSVYATTDGTVTEVSENYTDGKMVVITHANGYQSVYSCLDENVLVEKGDEVKAGEQIGTAGTTSNNEQLDGTHLHFEMLLNGENIDPASILDIENK